ncbi:MAG: hypothetical protein IC227_08220 [Enterococcus lacertideformus]|uniref:Uncharacterized protein n=1 Tax=Enterococcus lacertideformus TaxID=2771493 RepID=A0A931AZK0_9ENTE|nr:hypothetical protein [Enterococcus lacertideformus]
MNKNEAIDETYEEFVIGKVANFQVEKINVSMENKRIISNRRQNKGEWPMHK